MIATELVAPSAPSPRVGEALLARARARLAVVRAAFTAGDSWVLLSTCDWYPDAAGFPASHAALLALDAAEGG
jgi:hypothetical protein